MNTFLCISPIVFGLIGLIAGLAMRKINNFRRVQDILKAVGINILITFVIYFLYNVGFYGYYGLGSIILISSPILLVIMMLIFAKVARPEN